MDVGVLFTPEAKRQRYLDVEAALARAEASAGLIPVEAADAIAGAARLELLDTARLAAEEARTGHPMVALVGELARAAGEPYGGWAHWGVTTQNIQQTGDVLGVRTAVKSIEDELRQLLAGLSILGDATADMVTAGRTHSQHAVPMTFGLKVAAWSDIFLRHQERLRQCQPRLFVAMAGGAVGTFAALGAAGPRVQELVAEQLGLRPMDVPSRSVVDQFAELVCVLALVAATAQSVAEEVSRLMGTDFAEVSETLPEGDVGSSTMPQKRNAKLCLQTIIAAAQVPPLVPMAIGATIQAHEVDGARSAVMDRAVEGACTMTSSALGSLVRVIANLEVFPRRMAENLSRSHGLICAEAVMMALAPRLGRQVAHEVVHEAAKRVATTDDPAAGDFAAVLLADPRVEAYFSPAEVAALLDPQAHTGLSATIAKQTAARARAASRPC